MISKILNLRWEKYWNLSNFVIENSIKWKNDFEKKKKLDSQFTLEAMAHATLVQMTKPLKCVALVQVNMVIFFLEKSLLKELHIYHKFEICLP
jgi:hypothetical protein